MCRSANTNCLVGSSAVNGTSLTHTRVPCKPSELAKASDHVSPEVVVTVTSSGYVA